VEKEVADTIGNGEISGDDQNMSDEMVQPWRLLLIDGRFEEI
jgi:hypothetical protein